MRPPQRPQPFAQSTAFLPDDHDRRRFYMANAVAPLSATSPGSSNIGTHAPNASEIQSHLYSAFLEGRTSDVALHVRGAWEGIYRLHRVVLIQAGFFRSLFDGGFREAFRENGVQNEVNVTFDDPNITRAAFELYGGGPDLFIDPALIPSRAHPLTPSFPNPQPSKAHVPDDQQAATPSLLLSLLATATYLAIPSLISQALSLVLKSVGPRTALSYLNFAIGKGISGEGSTGNEAAVGLESLCQFVEPGSLRTSRAPSVRTMSFVSSSDRNDTNVDPDSSSSYVEKIAEDFASMRPLHTEETRRNYSETHSIYAHSALSNMTRDADADDEDLGPVFLYGAVSDKIGEAAVCWVCRWGVDVLPLEEAVSSTSESLNSPASPICVPGPSHLGDRHTITHSSTSVDGDLDVPLLWRRGGLPARWVRALLSSNCLFVKDERQRYEVARRIVELRRQEGVNPREESEWEELFATGIHYMHMSLDDLVEISHDVSPATGLPYVPPSVIQAAHWDQSLLRQHITVHPVDHLLSPSSSISTSASASTPTPTTSAFRPVSPPRSPGPPRDKDLGLSWSAGELRASSSTSKGIPTRGNERKAQMIYPVPTDASTRLGDSSGISPGIDASLSMEQLFNPRAQGPFLDKGKGSSGIPSPTPHPSHANFFGILSDSGRPVSALSDPQCSSVKKWTPFPPVRFGVEFWGVNALREKGRLHSQTIWYAGSLYNVYVQVVRKKDGKDKGLQLGVYLHRQSSVDPIPLPSAPPSPPHPHGSRFNHLVGGTGERRGSVTTGPVAPAPELATIRPSVSTPSLTRSTSRPVSRGTTTGVTGGAGPSRSTTPTSAVSSTPPSGGASLPAQYASYAGSSSTVVPAPIQPYRDPRPAVLAYFTIACAAPTGAALTRFASSPDEFRVSQSWGWKSSSLQTEEYLSPDDGDSAASGIPAKEVSLRATIVVGVV